VFRIGDFARLSRVSIRMLRHYDAVGLLRPAVVDQRTGYRFYAADQLPRLHRILALKDLGFRLDELAPLLGDDVPLSELRALLTKRHDELQRQLLVDRARLAQVDARLSAAEQANGATAFDVVTRAVETQWMASIRAVVPALGQPVESLFDEVEAFVARRRARAPHSPVMLFHDPPVRGAPVDVEAAVPVSRAIACRGRVTVREIAGAPVMACVVYVGGYEQTGAALAALRAWARQHRYVALGPPREVYIRFAADNAEVLRLPTAFLTDGPDRYVTEIQLPVAPAPRGNDRQRAEAPCP
jgi:DNA-binding transcriptional MerR regulator